MQTQLEDYIASHIDPEPDHLHRLYRHTHLHHLYPRMCSGHVQGRLLKMFTAMIAPRRILELGAFTGYSTLCLAEGMPDGATVDTVEIDDEMADELTQRFESSPWHGRINLITGDALEVLPMLDGPYDMAFVDANKRHYSQYINLLCPIMRKGGFILVDNTLWDMKVLDGALQSKHDVQAVAIAAFNDEMAHDPRFEKVMVPVRDGITILKVL